MKIDFSGKSFAVTGTSGIGLDAALYLARSGAQVFLAGIDAALNADAQAAAKAESLPVFISHVDVSDTASVSGWVAEISARTDKLHGLVNAAAIQTYGTAASTTPDEWDHTIAVNLRSCYLTSHLLYPLLRAAEGASIVHISSVQGHANQSAVLAYATTKGAIHALTRAMAVDCAAHKIRVNSVSPGSVHTPLLEYSARALAGDEKPIEEIIAEFGKSHPVGRVGTTQETSAMIGYLCSDAAAFVTGTDMKIDGGLTAQLGV
ncbi:MAG: SDR family oxidoreductase [Pseudoruegeria sp.]